MLERLPRQAFHFTGISFYLPDQPDLQLTVAQKPLAEIPGPSTAFIPIRVIGNFAVHETQTPQNYITHFDPPLIIDVGYIKADLYEAARYAQTLKLAYHNGEDWVVLTELSNNFRLLPASTASLGEAEIHDWAGDPPLAWGR